MSTTLLRPPRRISTARVRPTAGSAVATTAKIARSTSRARRSPTLPATAAARRRAADGQRPVADVAAAPVGLGLGAVAEVAEDRLAPARLALDVAPDLAVLAPAVVLRLRVVDLVDEEDVQALVAVLGEQHAARRQAVAPAAPGLLVVGLERGRHRLVDHRPHVGLVDAHPECVGRDDDRRLAGHERALRLGARFALHPRVVGRHRSAELAARASAAVSSVFLRVPA